MTKLLLAVIFFGSSALAEVVFDGYYKIENDGKHVGFAVRQLDIDAKKKTRTYRMFVHTLDGEQKGHEESLIATSADNLRPIESSDNDDGHTKKLKYDAKKKSKLQANEIFSISALSLLLENHPETGKFYSYMALRENNGTTNRGQMYVLKVKPMDKLQVYRVIDWFENPPIETWVASNGEILKELVPHKKLTSTLVKNADAAIGSIKFDRAVLKKTFGEIPTGQKNVLSDAANVVPDFPEPYSSQYTFEPYATALKLPAAK